MALLSVLQYAFGMLAGVAVCLYATGAALGVGMQVQLDDSIAYPPLRRVSDAFPLGIQAMADHPGFVAATLVGLALAGAALAAGRFIARRVRRTFCLAIAAVECLVFPIGTVLGVATLIVLARPTVRSMFATGGSS